jgi:hypothetical protein
MRISDNATVLDKGIYWHFACRISQIAKREVAEYIASLYLGQRGA